MVKAEKYKGPMPDALMPRDGDVQHHARNLSHGKAKLMIFKDSDGYLQGDVERGMIVIPPARMRDKHSMDGLGDSMLLTSIARRYPGCEKMERTGYQGLTLRGEALDFALKAFQTHRDKMFEVPVQSLGDDGKVNFNTSYITAILGNRRGHG